MTYLSHEESALEATMSFSEGGDPEAQPGRVPQRADGNPWAERCHPTGAPELAVIIPTFNERPNVLPLLEKLRLALDGIDWEAIFVDDNSPDGTAMVAQAAAQDDRRVRVMRRVGRRGLAGACIEGMLSTSACVVAVIDADLQHDETCLPSMLSMLRRDEADLVIASRYMTTGHAEAGLSGLRLAGSRAATSLARQLLRVETTDPMSGFFMIRRDVIDEVVPRLSQQGFKILLDIILSIGAEIRIREIPYTFRPRQAGDSKLDGMVVFEYLGLLVAKLSGDRVSIRFLVFAAVGSVGLLVHLSVLRLGLQSGMVFELAQMLAMSVATISNYLLNNLLTYRDRRRRSWRLLTGLVTYLAISSLGFAAGVSASSVLHAHDPSWWRAGIAGAVIGVGWNYLASRLVVWNGR
jgi:dolichol-phosphate mannosyltransferase